MSCELETSFSWFFLRKRQAYQRFPSSTTAQGATCAQLYLLCCCLSVALYCLAAVWSLRIPIMTTTARTGVWWWPRPCPRSWCSVIGPTTIIAATTTFMTMVAGTTPETSVIAGGNCPKPIGRATPATNTANPAAIITTTAGEGGFEGVNGLACCRCGAQAFSPRPVPCCRECLLDLIA